MSNQPQISVRQAYGMIIAQIPIKGIEKTAGGLLDDIDALEGGLIDINTQCPTLSAFRRQLRQALGESMPVQSLSP